MINLLVSYAYLRGKKTRERWTEFIRRTQPYARFMLDSGGYSIATLGLDLSLEDYIADLQGELDGLFWQYVSLDEPLNWPKSKANIEVMADAGLSAMNVLTIDAPVEDAVRLVEINPHICLAGGIHEDLPFYRHRMEQVMRVTEGRARVHGLGFTRPPPHVLQTKVYSIDSSTWTVGKQYGNFTVFDPVRGCRQFNTKRILQDKGRNLDPVLRQVFLRHRVRMTDLLSLIKGEGRSRSQNTIIDLLSCRAWYEYSEFMRRRSVSFFFASGTLNLLAPLFAVIKADLEGTPVASMTEYSWHLHDATRDDFTHFVDEAVDILRRLHERQQEQA